MSDTTPPTRVFHSIAAAEEAYRAEVERNEIFTAKFDILEEKLDRLTTALEQLATALTTTPPPPLPPRPLEAKLKPLLLSEIPRTTSPDSVVKPRPRPLSFSSTASTALIKFGLRRQSLPSALPSDNYATVSDRSSITVTTQGNSTVPKVPAAPVPATRSIEVNKEKLELNITDICHKFPKPRTTAPSDSDEFINKLYYDSGYDNDDDTFAVDDDDVRFCKIENG
jgi:hypothetical protein